jgi:Zn-dependent membrane protease YugP
MLVLGVVLKDSTFGIISISLIIVVSLYDLYLINIYKNNITKSIKILSSNGLIDKDEKEDIKKIMEVESLRGLTRLINVIKVLSDIVIPYE